MPSSSVTEHRLTPVLSAANAKQELNTVAETAHRPSKATIRIFDVAVISFLAFVAGLLLSPFSPGGLNLGRHPPFTSQEQLHPINNATGPSPSSPRTPSSHKFPVGRDAIDSSYFHDDFPTHFGLSVLHTTHVDSSVAEYLKAHDIKQDERYTEDPEVADEWRRRIGWVFEDGFPDEQRFEVRWVSKEIGYGVFAKMHVAKGSIVGVFGSVITNSDNSDYMWTYPSEILDADGNVISLGFDAQYRGNFLRFVNHADGPNTEVVYVPYDGIWQIVYMAVRLIEAGEELTVDYGSNYWEHRPGMLVQEGQRAVESDLEGKSNGTGQ
ncbi:hypothetical protein DFJ73DRAFT_773855 [Zopfochytrium polystomum]|nr:hypothetical protein DFJ73DRAFT_773855 [Zopfochytrium polystomum]